MPIFEFHCKECTNDFRTLRRADKVDEVTCPDCGTDRVVRLISVTARSAGGADPQGCGMPAVSC
jgi:putative FmdB family regulatory protein